MKSVIPPGCRFVPTDQELIKEYLEKKSTGQIQTWDCVVEADLYGQDPPWVVLKEDNQHPWQKSVFGEKHKKSIYVLTELKKVNADTGSRFVRSTGECGSWDGRTKSKAIFDEEDSRILIGRRKMFTYVSNHRELEGTKGHWLMHEYTLAGSKGDSCHVLCRITRDDSKFLRVAAASPPCSSEAESEIYSGSSLSKSQPLTSGVKNKIYKGAIHKTVPSSKKRKKTTRYGAIESTSTEASTENYQKMGEQLFYGETVPIEESTQHFTSEYDLSSLQLRKRNRFDSEICESQWKKKMHLDDGIDQEFNEIKDTRSSEVFGKTVKESGTSMCSLQDNLLADNVKSDFGSALSPQLSSELGSNIYVNEEVATTEMMCHYNVNQEELNGGKMDYIPQMTHPMINEVGDPLELCYNPNEFFDVEEFLDHLIEPDGVQK